MYFQNARDQNNIEYLYIYHVYIIIYLEDVRGTCYTTYPQYKIS